MFRWFKVFRDRSIFSSFRFFLLLICSSFWFNFQLPQVFTKLAQWEERCVNTWIQWFKDFSKSGFGVLKNPPQNGMSDTVDGQNPAPPRMMIIPLFIGFLTIPGDAGFCPSTVSDWWFPGWGWLRHDITGSPRIWIHIFVVLCLQTGAFLIVVHCACAWKPWEHTVREKGQYNIVVSSNYIWKLGLL